MRWGNSNFFDLILFLISLCSTKGVPRRRRECICDSVPGLRTTLVYFDFFFFHSVFPMKLRRTLCVRNFQLFVLQSWSGTAPARPARSIWIGMLEKQPQLNQLPRRRAFRAEAKYRLLWHSVPYPGGCLSTLSSAASVCDSPRKRGSGFTPNPKGASMRRHLQ